MSEAFDQTNQMMESVVLDNVVFEDVISSTPNDHSAEQIPAERDAVSPRSSSRPIGIRSTESPSSDIPSSAPAATFHNESTYPSSFPESSPFSPSSFPGESTFQTQYNHDVGGAFAPEYHREPSTSSSPYAPESFHETSFVPEMATRPPAPQREAIPVDINVTEPEKFGDGMNSYINYKIKTQSTLPKFRESSVVVRRYNDFLWFHEQLRTNNKGVLVPPLPEKALINRFSPEFVETRRKELEKFLNRVAQHPILHRSPQFVFFLESSEDQFNAVKSRTTKVQPTPEQPPPQQTTGSGFGSFVSFIGHGIAAAANLTAASSSAREIDQWFDAKKNYVNALESHLGSLLKSTTKLLAKRRELAAAHSDFSSSMSIVGSCEAESDTYLSTAFIRIAQITEHIKDLGEQLFKNESTHFEEALRDYLRVLSAVKDMLADRDEVLLDYQNATRTLEAKREKLEKDRARSTATKVRGAEKEVEDAQKKVEDTKREYEALSATVRAELEVFDTTRAKEIRRMIALLTQSNMEHSLQVVDLWKSYISETQGSDEKDWKTADKVGWGGVGSLR